MLTAFQPRRRPRRGITLVELLIGSAVGLLVVSGALTLMARNLGTARNLLAEAKLNQDLRTAMDLIVRDLRRSGWWGNALQGTLVVGAGSTTTQNPYATVGGDVQSLSYGFSRDSTENNALDSNEQFGFRVDHGKLQMQDGSGQWQDMTDTGAMTIVEGGLAIVPSVTTLPLGNLCPKVCSAGTPNCPQTQVRNYSVTLTALSARDPAIMRTLRSTVRLRNDRLAGQCPA